MAVTPVSPVSIPHALPGAAISPARDGGGFQELFAGAIRRVEDSRREASASTERFLSGENQELHQTVLSVQEAELAFEMFLQVRNKVVQAYQEVMRMQL